MVSAKLSPHQIRVLSKMAELAKAKDFAFIRPREIAKAMGSTPKAVEAVLLRLRKKGIVENMGYGAWRITELGWKVLKELGYA